MCDDGDGSSGELEIAASAVVGTLTGTRQRKEVAEELLPSQKCQPNNFPALAYEMPAPLLTSTWIL